MEMKQQTSWTETGQLPPTTDLELLQKARCGDTGAFHELVDRHGPRLYGLAVRLVGNSADAEDVVQETFTGAFRGLRAFRGQSSVKTWLTQILVRQAVQHHRSRRRHATVSLDQPAAGVPEVPPGQRQADIRMDVSKAILSLGREHREVIVLRELQGMSYDDISTVLAVPKGTVESRLFRARRELQGLLKGYLP